ncbi:myophilin-like isoform X1 [Actinia tenebrosa]|uniref:Myophilin-like isoform X1 n=1 Tax=Actinia tenebrosa TaxID=6105 RepID=A0A6P8I677_ACTTE|nr:myophilin-like isoform X1 [Actinia tenebrosa]
MDEVEVEIPSMSNTKSKISGKWDDSLVSEICSWITKHTGESFKHGNQDEFAASLKDGVILCNLANAIQPGAIRKPNKPGKMAFKMMENIGWFVDFITAYGVQHEYIFVTVDLYEKQNVWQVVLALRALKDKAAEKGIN